MNPFLIVAVIAGLCFMGSEVERGAKKAAHAVVKPFHKKGGVKHASTKT